MNKLAVAGSMAILLAVFAVADEPESMSVTPFRIAAVGTPVTNNSQMESSWTNGLFVATNWAVHRASPEQRADMYVSSIRVDGSLSNVVNLLVSQGEVCKVKGHFWRDGRPGENEYGHGIFADYHPGVSYRTCRLCGACQSKTEGEWK